MRRQKINQQLLYLFLSSFTVYFVGMSLFPLLPLYATQFGATRNFVGIFLALIYLSNALGPMLAGWLADKLSRKGLFIVASAVGTPAAASLGYATEMWQVVALTATLWFSGGVVMALVNVFTGLNTDTRSRGRSFSLMSMAMPLGALVGGAVVGKLIDWSGYKLMFLALGGVWTALPLIGALGLQDRQVPSTHAFAEKPDQDASQFSLTFYLLLLISLLSTTTISISRLGTSLSMQALEFSASVIAGSVTVSGLATIPLTYLLGILSDRLGRKHLLTMSFLIAGGGTLTLSFATQLWQFWLATTLIMVALGSSMAMGSAFATDLLKPEALNKGLSWHKAALSAAGILSFASAGYMLDLVGPKTLYTVAAALPLAGAAVLELIPFCQRTGLPLLSAWANRLFILLKSNQPNEQLRSGTCQ